MSKVYAELIMWDIIKRDCKYPDNDNNNNYIYGLNFLDFEGDGDIYEVMWFINEEERHKCILDNNAIIINELN